MNFIVEFLPKKASGSLTIVVRNPQGFPLGVFDTLEDATVFIQNKYHEIMNSNDNVEKSAM